MASWKVKWIHRICMNKFNLWTFKCLTKMGQRMFYQRYLQYRIRLWVVFFCTFQSLKITKVLVWWHTSAPACRINHAKMQHNTFIAWQWGKNETLFTRGKSNSPRVLYLLELNNAFLKSSIFCLIQDNVLHALWRHILDYCRDFSFNDPLRENTNNFWKVDMKHERKIRHTKGRV